ncbi:hypothetical protein GCM10009754_42800 [Amycolatopsis minnesotensis]|uniref:Uncharacterized protein n=1 Tax=Amycolatopsis minnesotensis TaxID=337894 RepID=A0ABP5CRW6_9PSEU
MLKIARVSASVAWDRVTVASPVNGDLISTGAESPPPTVRRASWVARAADGAPTTPPTVVGLPVAWPVSAGVVLVMGPGSLSLGVEVRALWAGQPCY